MKVNGLVRIEMDLVYKFGVMVQNTRENGRAIEQMGEESFGI
jgi:hypothetical protein